MPTCRLASVQVNQSINQINQSKLNLDMMFHFINTEHAEKSGLLTIRLLTNEKKKQTGTKKSETKQECRWEGLRRATVRDGSYLSCCSWHLQRGGKGVGQHASGGKSPETQLNTKNERKALYLRQSPALVFNVLDQLCVYYSVNIEIPV